MCRQEIVILQNWEGTSSQRMVRFGNEWFEQRQDMLVFSWDFWMKWR